MDFFPHVFCLFLRSSDVFTIDTANSNPSSITLDEDGIAWASDDVKFQQPAGFKYVEVSDFTTTCAQEDMPTGCKQYTSSDGTKYLYYYPNDDTVQYLYESYPDHISPIIGVTDQHFKVWMRPAALPQFRKLYGTYSHAHFTLLLYMR
jgi:hypothetical protein